MNITLIFIFLEDNDTDSSDKGITEMGQGQRREDEEKNKQQDEQLNDLLCSIGVNNSKSQLSYRRLFSLGDASMGTQSPWHPMKGQTYLMDPPFGTVKHSITLNACSGTVSLHTFRTRCLW